MISCTNVVQCESVVLSISPGSGGTSGGNESSSQ